MVKYVLVSVSFALFLVVKDTSALSATQVLQRQRSTFLGASPLVATKGASTSPSATTVMTSPKLGRGLMSSDNIVDLSEDIKPSKQKVCVCVWVWVCGCGCVGV